MNNFETTKIMLEIKVTVDTKLQQVYNKKGKEIEAALKKQAQIFPQMTIVKSIVPQDLYDGAPDSIRFDVKWNKKYFISFIVHIDFNPRNKDEEDMSPYCTVGVDGRGIIHTNSSKLPDEFENKFNKKKGIETYMHVKQAVDMALAKLPPDEVPEEYRGK